MGKFNFDQTDFERVRAEAELYYSTLHEVYCPYFREKIAFNAKGYKHLRFKSDRQARSHTEQYARFKLLPLAPQVLQHSHTLQGVWEANRFEAVRTNTRWEHTIKNVRWFEFIAVLDAVRLKVIVKQVEGGQKHFWSIIPFWGRDTTNRKRILHSGDPEND